ncbi:TorF family putative porin [Ramlibacter tataouinensis]|uniref:TorF family putative porin n=1 Tax=Ramlibacter tataouinensis TaxID=94132 RepID=UPI0022F3C23C|nr:TorF family putative porin [Ramlibacter tataouinensis]WBX99965.1 TorF family putative porin [Ramlibacter tataouinensis]
MKAKAAFLLSALVPAGAALAQAQAPQPDHTFAFNAGAISDYRYRGISQSRLRPALQGGVDYTHASGLYLGAWASSIRWIKDGGGGADAELDLYGGWRFPAGPLGLDLGVLTYNYPGHELATSPNTQEGYVAASWGPATLKYSHAFSNLFGFANSKNSYYLDLSASFDLGRGWSLVPHVGHQKVKNNDPSSYTDYAVTLNKDFGKGLSASAAWVDTDSNGVYLSPGGKNLGRSGLVLGVKYAF